MTTGLPRPSWTGGHRDRQRGPPPKRTPPPPPPPPNEKNPSVQNARQHSGNALTRECRRTADHWATEAILDRRTQRLAKGTTTKVHPPEKISVLCKILYSILECPDQGKQETVSLSPDVRLTIGLPRRTGNWQRDPHQCTP